MIKWFDSSLMAGLPELTNTQGDLVKMLNALLVNGANEKPVVTISYADGFCTLEVGADHGFVKHSIVVVRNSSQSVLTNSEFRVLKVTTTTISFKVATNVTNEVGATVAYPPLGFEQHFASEGKSCYKSPNPDYPAYLRVDDTKLSGTASGAAKFAGVEICADMTDFNSSSWQSPYTDIYPTQNRATISDRSNGWFKWYYASSHTNNPDVIPSTEGVRRYIMVGDNTSFWLVIYPYTGNDSKRAEIIGLPLVDFGDKKTQTLVAVNGFGGAFGYPHVALSQIATSISNTTTFLDSRTRGMVVGFFGSGEILRNALLRSPLFLKEDTAPRFLTGAFNRIATIPSKTVGESLVFSGSSMYKVIETGEDGYNIAIDAGGY